MYISNNSFLHSFFLLVSLDFYLKLSVFLSVQMFLSVVNIIKLKNKTMNESSNEKNTKFMVTMKR